MRQRIDVMTGAWWRLPLQLRKLRHLARVSGKVFKASYGGGGVWAYSISGDSDESIMMMCSLAGIESHQPAGKQKETA